MGEPQKTSRYTSTLLNAGLFLCHKTTISDREVELVFNLLKMN